MNDFSALKRFIRSIFESTNKWPWRETQNSFRTKSPSRPHFMLFDRFSHKMCFYFPIISYCHSELHAKICSHECVDHSNIEKQRCENFGSECLRNNTSRWLILPSMNTCWLFMIMSHTRICGHMSNMRTSLFLSIRSSGSYWNIYKYYSHKSLNDVTTPKHSRPTLYGAAAIII